MGCVYTEASASVELTVTYGNWATLVVYPFSKMLRTGSVSNLAFFFLQILECIHIPNEISEG